MIRCPIQNSTKVPARTMVASLRGCDQLLASRERAHCGTLSFNHSNLSEQQTRELSIVRSVK